MDLHEPIIFKQKKINEEHWEIKQREESTLVLVQTPETGYLKVINSQYAFELQRPREDGPWLVIGVGNDIFKQTPLDDPKTFSRDVMRWPYTFGTIVNTLNVTLMDPGFSIKKVSPVTKGNQKIVKVDFHYSPSENLAKKPLRAGSVLFDPTRYWIMRSFEVHLRVGNEDITDFANFDYYLAGDGFPILKKIVNRRQNLSRKVDVEFLWEFDLKEGKIPPGAFRLSAYGFPEPQGVVWPKPPRWHLWFIGVSLISLAIGAYCRRRLLQRKLMVANDSPTFQK